MTPRGQASWTGRSSPSSAWSSIRKNGCLSFCTHFSETTSSPGWVLDFTLAEKSMESLWWQLWHLRNTSWLVRRKLGGNGMLFFLLWNSCIVERGFLRLPFFKRSNFQRFLFRFSKKIFNGWFVWGVEGCYGWFRKHSDLCAAHVLGHSEAALKYLEGRLSHKIAQHEICPAAIQNILRCCCKNEGSLPSEVPSECICPR